MRFFEESPHSQGFRKRGLSQCVACHDNHDIQRATALMVGTGPDATCMKCHGHDDKPRQVADQIAALLRTARSRAGDARDAVARASERGLHVSGAAFALSRVETAETKVRGVVHTLDPARVGAVVGEIDQAVEQTLALVAEAERARAVERRGYYVALGLAASLLVTLLLKARDLDRRRARGAP
jgi:hypothetical protein